MGRGAYINGRYVANAGAKGAGKSGGGGRGRDATGRTVGWTDGEDRPQWQRKPGDEDIDLERKFDIDILGPGETRRGYLFNVKPTRHYDEGGRALSGLLLYFLQRDGRTFRSTFLYRPYFFVQVKKGGIDTMRDILAQRFEQEGVVATIVQKEDLALEDHIVGRKRPLIKLSFQSTEGANKARIGLFQEMKSKRMPDSVSFDSPNKPKGDWSASDELEELYEHDVPYVNRVCIDNKINVGKWYDVTRNPMVTSVEDLYDTQSKVTELDMQKKPGLRIFAWDIETTKEPLKFPDSARDRITMISIMVDGSGFLIVNRSEVSADIEPLEYTPKPEYEGVFQTFNEEDEAGLLRRFFALMRETCPHVMVSFNGDFFDYPFVTNRAKAYNMDWTEEAGIQKVPNEEYYAGKWIVHLDCFAWVQRDSYLPCGARGLKAVTRYKLKYDPVELDPEDMTPFARERPQELAAYSVSDAVATYYLYMKYIHDFIFALCSIIPYGPDEVLRKGSGTLCESLLMNQAAHASVLFPNKHHDPPLEYHEGTNRLIEQSTYEGARVECMRVGVYRADIKETFQIEPQAVQTLLDDLKGTVDFFLTEEEKVKIEDVENYEETLQAVEDQLRQLCDPTKVAEQVGRMSAAETSQFESPEKAARRKQEEYNLQLVEYEITEGKGGVKSGGKKVKKSSYRVIKDDYPLIYHLDVGAMYPNIILSNRLQPMAIVTKEFCNSCSYNAPSNNCQRSMDWKWRGDLYMATRADVRSIVNEMENDKRRYSQKDKDTGETHRVKWSELKEGEQVAEITKAVRQFSQRAYKRLKSSVYEDRTDIVCQRENPFYVNTVLNFRDRRYMFKRKTKEWNKKLEKAEESGDLAAKNEAKDMVLLNDSLQLAHKCILNSFYGYVMRKGARWHSMKMAGIVTYTGSNLIREAREFCEQVGLPLELDTDGIWCLLPKSFPDTFKIKMKGGKELKMPYPNCVLNYRVHQKYTNHQYQDWDPTTNSWKTSSQNSILFEIDGPYKAMILPASTEEDKMLKKRYAVYNFDGSLAELKGFEVKRRGELRLIQVFQTEVFPEFLKGESKEEVWKIVGAMANRWLDVIASKGSTMTNDEVIHFFSENKTMSKSVEQAGTYKSVQATTVRRLAEFLGVPSMLQAEGISAHMLIASKPVNASCTERAIPVKIFFAEEEVKKTWLRHWLQDSSLTDFDMRSIIDWEYYKERLCAVFQKLISIPAAYQKISNPCPRVKVPEWLRKRVAEQNDQFKQRSLGIWFRPATTRCGEGDPFFEGGKRKLGDIEDLAGLQKKLEDLPQVEYGEGPKKWLQVQKMRWNAGQAAASQGARRHSLFDAGAEYTALPAEALTATWHVLAVEPSTSSSTDIKVGDSVMAEVVVDYMDDLDAHHPEERIEVYKGTVLGFVGGMVRVMLETGEEQILKRSSVQAIKDGGLFTMWVAVGDAMAVYRCEVMVKRQVILALEQDVAFDTHRAVRPMDLHKGLQVASPHRGDGVVSNLAPEIGLCSVRWESGNTEVMSCKDLLMQSSDATKVLRDAPRNLRHPCLLQMEMSEADFQQQNSEGFLGELPSSLRVSSIYEAEAPLLFDFVCRLGPLVKFTPTPGSKETQARGLRRIDFKDLTPQAGSQYLPNLSASQNVYLYLSFDTNHSARAFCGIFAPTLSEAWICFSGTVSKESDPKRQELDSFVRELFADVSLDGCSKFVRTEVSFLNGKSLHGLVLWAEQRLAEIRKLDGGCVCVVSSQLSAAELRGLAPSCYVEQQALRHVEALREMPILQAPHTKGKFVLDWPRSISKYFARLLPSLAGWWRDRRTLCRSAGIPICNGPESIAACANAALDVMYSRQLQKDSQIRWASPGCRPDLGATSLAVIDAQEEAVEAVSWVLQGRDHSSGKGGGQVNRPGVYRTFCVELNLRTKLCVCALLNARHLSDMEGGELSRKMIRKVGAGDSFLRNMDHSSEASVTNLESLVTMAQEICKGRDTKAAEMAELRKSWAAQSETARAALAEAQVQIESANCNDEDFKSIMEQHHCEDVQLAQKLQDLRDEWQAFENLLDGLYGWLASPTSLLYDPALLRRVHQYMDRVLKILLDVVRRNGCTVIHASHSKVLLETGKLRMYDAQLFYTALIQSIQSSRALVALDLDNASAVAAMYYGVLWLDPSDWAGIPLSETGRISWEVSNFWRFTDYLPAAVSVCVETFASDLLLEPQRKLGQRLGFLNDTDDAAPPAEAELEETELEAKDSTAMDEDEEDDEHGDCVRDRDVDMEPANPAPEAASTNDKQTAQALEDLKTWIKEEWFEDQRRVMLTYVSELQVTRQRDLSQDVENLPPGEDSEEDEEDPGNDSEDPHAASIRRQERLRRRIEQRWEFPDMPGRKAPPGAVDFEALRSIIQVYKLEQCILEQVEQLRDRMCQRLRVSSFSQGLDFEKPSFPLILRDVACGRCCVAAHVDVTSHPTRAPGLWVCDNCQGTYDKDGMEARLVDLLHNIIQAWHSQEITCSKCRSLRTCYMQDFCTCFGRWQVNFKEGDFRLLLQVLASLTGPHSLDWLKEALESYAGALP